MAKKGTKYITVHTYRGLVDKVSGVPLGYSVRISDYDEGTSERVTVEYRKKKRKSL